MNVDSSSADNNLIRQVAGGDEKAFRQLVHQYSGLIFSYVFQHADTRETAEEIVQDVFVQLWLMRDSLTEIRNLKTFMFIVARNRALDELKRVIRQRKRLKNLQAIATEESDTDQEKYLGIVDKAIENLPPQQQRVWVLSRRGGKKYSEIAQEMNLSRETVKTYLQLANASILAFLQQRIEILLLLALPLEVLL